ncbi:phospholipid carrier-dependent glycosyltransferase [Candidatus Kuenenbacteria bacterium]|nr:phospholipid carrier-dependent glycosyltransferase [Candidatus Kuenenbacteria bacterium]
MKKSSVILYLVLIILAGLALRLVAVFHSQSFWFDEIVSLKIAEKGLVASWQYLQWENNPPLHYWLLHFWIKLFGSSELVLRLSSVLFSTLNIFLLYLLGKKISGRPAVGLFAALLSAFSCYHLFTSMDARMYPLLLSFGLLSFYFFWDYLETGSRRQLFFYALFAVAALYTHLTAVFIFAAVNLYWLFRRFLWRQKTPPLASWLLANLLVILAWLPWFISFAVHNLSRLSTSAWYFHTNGSGFFLFELPRSFFFLGDEIPLIELFALIFLGLLFLLAFLRLREFSLFRQEIKIKLDPAPGAVFALFIFIVPLMIGFCFQVWVSKYYILGSAGLFLILALGFDRLHLQNFYLKISLAVLMVLFAPYNFWIIKNQGQHQWTQATAYVEQNLTAGDTIFFPAFIYELVLNHYATKPLPLNHNLTADLGTDRLLLAIKYNWYPLLDVKTLPDFQQFFHNAKRVFLIYPDTSAPVHRSELVLDWFYNHAWTKVSEKHFGGFERTTIYIFKNPAL